MKIEQKQRNEIIDGIRAGIAKVKHHEKCTSRVGNAIQAALPAYTIHLGPNFLRVWGNGILFQDSVFLCWNWKAETHWADCMEPAIQREDTRDRQERLVDERAYYPGFERLNQEAVRLLVRVAELRECAQKTIESLPVPKAATLRKHWTSAQTETKEKFPNLFGSVSLDK